MLGASPIAPNAAGIATVGCTTILRKAEMWKYCEGGYGGKPGGGLRTGAFSAETGVGGIEENSMPSLSFFKW